MCNGCEGCGSGCNHPNDTVDEVYVRFQYSPENNDVNSPAFVRVPLKVKFDEQTQETKDKILVDLLDAIGIGTNYEFITKEEYFGAMGNNTESRIDIID